MGVIFHKNKKYGGTGVKVQSDPAATSLNALEVPNGQTMTSYLNSKLGNFIKSVNLTTTVNLPALPSGNAGSTVGKTNGHSAASINLTTLSGYPTGKTILGIFPQIGRSTTANYVLPHLFVEGTNGFVYGLPQTAYSVSFKVIYLE